MCDSDASIPVAMASAVVALGALFVAAWAGYLQWRHSRLSVRPHLDFVYGNTSDGALALWLVNNGIGPAVVKQFDVEALGSAIEPTAHCGRWDCAFSELGTSSPVHENEPLVDQFLAAGARLLLLDGGPEVELTQDTEMAVRAIGSFEAALSRMTVTVGYESVYGEKFLKTWSLTRNAR